MNNVMLGMLALIGSASALYADLPEHLFSIYGESLEAAQQVMTAGDLHSLSLMLDAKYIMDRKLPKEDEFGEWLNITFKENNVKNLADDHWGTPYIYKVYKKRRAYQLISAGSDKKFGTHDDMIKSGP